ncbi:MAG: polysaccharide deacetylase family protein [Elusimicrobiota bacterium]
MITNRITVLYYHHVGLPPWGVKFKGGFVHPWMFARQMEWLKKKYFRVVPLTDLVSYLRGDVVLPERTAVLTFDDGYHDFYLYAYPVLKKYNYPAAVFISPGLIGGYNEWDHEKIHAKLPLMTMEQVNDTIASGLIDYGAHTLTHPFLSKLDDEKVIAEVVGSKKLLETKTGRPVLSFCYPYGDYDRRVCEIVKKEFSVAFTTHRGFVYKDSSPWELKRVEVKRNTWMLPFRIKLLTDHEEKKGENR